MKALKVKASLDETMVLRRVPGLQLDLDSSQPIRIGIAGRILLAGPHALAVLDAFAQPVSLGQAMERLQPGTAGLQDWLDLIGTVQALLQQGVQAEASGIHHEIGAASETAPRWTCSTTAAARWGS